MCKSQLSGPDRMGKVNIEGSEAIGVSGVF